MSIFSRLTDIINSNLNAMLDKAEDPEKVIRLVIQEMEDTLVEIRSAAARTIADKKEHERKMHALRHEQDEWQAKAELAVAKGREDLAKGALRERAKISDQLQVLEKELTHIEESIRKYSDDIGQLQAKLNDAKARQKTLVMRRHTAANQIKVRRQLDTGRVDKALAKFEIYEKKLDSEEAEVESFGLGRKKTLSDEINDLESEERVQKELEELKARLSSRGSE